MVGTKDVDNLRKDNLSSKIMKCTLRKKYSRLDLPDDNNDIIVQHNQDLDSSSFEKGAIKSLENKCSTGCGETSSKAINLERVNCEDPFEINSSKLDDENEVVAVYVDDVDSSSTNKFEGLECKYNINPISTETKREKLLRLFKVFTKFHYLIFLLSTLILSASCYAPVLVVMGPIRLWGPDEKMKYVYLVGFTCCIGVVALACAGNRPRINVIKVYSTFLIICGISIAIYPLVKDNFGICFMISVINNILLISFFVFTPTIVMKLMPIEYFSVAYGLNLLCVGIGVMIMPLIIAILMDWVHREPKSVSTNYRESIERIEAEVIYVIAIGGLFVFFSGLCVYVAAVCVNKNGNTLRPKKTDDVEEGVKEAIELKELIVNP